MLTYSNGKEQILCNADTPTINIGGKVVECSDYAKKGTKALWELKEEAWIIETKGKTFVGFVSPQKRKERGIDDPDKI